MRERCNAKGKVMKAIPVIVAEEDETARDNLPDLGTKHINNFEI